MHRHPDSASLRSPLLIREALLCPPGLEALPRDILLHDGKIAAVADANSLEVPSNAEILPARGKYLFPSFIDAHAHLREPGHEYKEDIASGLNAAAHGGFGTVFAMGNTVPCNDAASVTRFMLERAKAAWPHGPRLCPVGALTLGLAGTALSPMGELAQAGCIAFSNDGKPVADTEIFRRGIEYAAQWDRIVIDHCEDPFLAKNSHMNEGRMSSRLGIKGQPTVAEALHVARDILLAEYLDLPVHLAHISCRQSVELLLFAKARGIKVSAETCPHYLFLDETALDGYRANAKVNPPLRSAGDVAAVRKALADGLFDMLVTDHAPHAGHEKEDTLDAVPSGLIGLETALPLTFALVRLGELALPAFLHLWHYGPARIFRLPAVTFTPGDAADVFLFDPDQEWRVSRETLHSKSLNTPFLGWTMQGKVIAHWMGGHRIV